ncbi:MAG: ADP-glyceromanno-heptose 6-epimerase, partial [Bacteroidales bacterium]|nr:ADP-glyceromanno-heptose 6-epimerase [Bacteroidales bacterium]
IVTGAAGFIGSNLVRKLNDEGFKDIVLVDDFTSNIKNKNFKNKTFSFKIDRSEFIEWIPSNHRFIQFIFHMGARTDTTEFDVSVFKTLNLDYSKMIWNKCIEFGLPLVYASSAATYGLGEQGYHDNHTVIEKLKPLNPYGESKNEFDKWAVKQERKPYYWAGLKFFNVYGPNEYHKDRMASVVFHTFNQIKNTGKMKLFRSLNPEFKDGEQARDFVYVKDVVEVMYFLMHHRKDPGIYNVGTGKAETFLELVRNTFKVMHIPEKIEYIDIPADIRDKYQYFTEAKMSKLRSIGYKKDFYSLEDGISDYVTNYLIEGNFY